MKIGIISQARMTSSRLPGKILLEANGKPALKYHIDNLKKTKLPVLIATTTNQTDDVIEDFAQKENLLFYRGDEENVLSRFYEASKINNFETIIRVTSDCPFIDGNLILEGLEKYLNNYKPNLYLSNMMERTFPRGFDFEIFSFQQLEEAYQKAVLKPDLEHVTTFMRMNRNQKMEFIHLKNKENKSNYRITLDTSEDWELIKTMIEKYDADKMNHQEIIKLLDENPDLVKINAHIEQKKINE